MTNSIKGIRPVPILRNPVEYLVKRAGAAAARLLVAPAGTSDSGKMTLAAYLQQQGNQAAGSNSCMALGMDGFHFYKAELRQMPDPELVFSRRGTPWTFNVSALS